MSNTFLEAFNTRYLKVEEDEQHTVSGKKVEMVGMEKHQAKLNKTNTIRTVSLREMPLTSAGADGEILETCPNVTDLDLSICQIKDFQIVADVCRQLKSLQILDLSCNPLQLITPNTNSLIGNFAAFEQLQSLVLNKTETTFVQVFQMAKSLPALQELNMESNGMTSLSEVQDDVKQPTPEAVANAFPKLEHVNLSSNALNGWEAFDVLSQLPNLQTLVLNDNEISEIPFLSTRTTPPTKYLSLVSLSIMNNPIRDPKWVNALDTFPKLASLRMSPVIEGQSSVQSRMSIIPQLPFLLNLNNSKITTKERTESQKLYLKSCAAELVKMSVQSHTDDCSDLPEDFAGRHPYYPMYVKDIGNPLPKQTDDQAGADAQPNQALIVQLVLRSNVAASMQKGDKRKKLPTGYSIDKLKTLFQSLFGLPADKQRLIAKIGAGGDIPVTVELDDEFRDLQYYCLTDGTLVEMHERDLEEEERQAQAKKKEQELKLQQQLQDGDSKREIFKA